jgi:phage terminase large subunit-like protein
VKESAPSRWRRDPLAFIEECVIDPGTGRPFVLYDEQRQFIRYAFERRPDGRFKRNNWAFSAHKKSGKSTLASLMTLYVAVVLSPLGGQIHIVSNDFDQAVRRIFRICCEIIRASPRLRQVFTIAASKITVRATGTTITAVASEYRGFSGGNPTLNVFDEAAYYNSENAHRMYDEGMPSPTLRLSARLCVSTAGFTGDPSPLHDTYERVVEGGIELEPEFYQRGNELCFWSHRPQLAPWISSEWIEQQKTTPV